MSLDIYLKLKGVQNLDSGRHIFIREDGATREISRSEWDARFPGREPVTVELESDDEYVYDANITHNLGKMADVAGLYKLLWRPDENGITHARQLINPLAVGLAALKDNPDYYRQYNPSNGWGSYESLVRFVEGYLTACKEHPDAEVHASR